MHCNNHNIETAPELRNYYKNEISRIKKKGQGKRTRWEDKIVNLTNYKLNSFFKPIKFQTTHGEPLNFNGKKVTFPIVNIPMVNKLINH